MDAATALTVAMLLFGTAIFFYIFLTEYIRPTYPHVIPVMIVLHSVDVVAGFINALQTPDAFHITVLAVFVLFWVLWVWLYFKRRPPKKRARKFAGKVMDLGHKLKVVPT